MGWSINVAGSKIGVKRQLQALAGEIDPAQLDAVRNYLVPAINALPDDVGVFIKASGHLDERTYQLIMKVQALQLALDTQAAPTSQ